MKKRGWKREGMPSETFEAPHKAALEMPAQEPVLVRVFHLMLQQHFQDQPMNPENTRCVNFFSQTEVYRPQEVEDFHRCRERLQATQEKMISRLREVQSSGELRLMPRKELINEFLLAGIVAETGPLDDFESWQQLLRYAGLNLCEHQSGTMTGRRKISKKGRALLRKVPAHAVLPRVRRTDLYGDYYHGKKARTPGQKAMMAVARKFLKLLWGLNRAQSYDRARVFSCQSQHAAKALKQAA